MTVFSSTDNCEIVEWWTGRQFGRAGVRAPGGPGTNVPAASAPGAGVSPWPWLLVTNTCCVLSAKRAAFRLVPSLSLRTAALTFRHSWVTLQCWSSDLFPMPTSVRGAVLSTAVKAASPDSGRLSLAVFLSAPYAHGSLTTFKADAVLLPKEWGKIYLHCAGKVKSLCSIYCKTSFISVVTV